MSTQEQSSAQRTVESLKGLETETDDQWISDRNLAWTLPAGWALMYVFIVTTLSYPGIIWLNWPMLLVFTYIFFLKSAP